MNKEVKVKEKKPLSKEETLFKLRSTLMVLKMKSKMGQLVQTHQVKKIKKDIARLLTGNSQVKKEVKNK